MTKRGPSLGGSGWQAGCCPVGLCGSCAGLSGRFCRGSAALAAQLKVPSGAFLRNPGRAFASLQHDRVLVFRLSRLPYGTTSANGDACGADGAGDGNFSMAQRAK